MIQYAHVAVMHDDRMKAHYGRLKKRNRPSVAITHVANKMLTIIWHTADQKRAVQGEEREPLPGKDQEGHGGTVGARGTDVVAAPSGCCGRAVRQGFGTRYLRHPIGDFAAMGGRFCRGTGRPVEHFPTKWAPSLKMLPQNNT